MLRRFLFAALLTGMPPALFAGEITVVGSDLLRPALEPVLAPAARGSGGSLRLRLEGSHAGLQELRAGKADLAVVAFAPNEPLPDAEFRLVPLAYQVDVLVVTGNNPIRQVSYAQLGGLFGEKEPVNHRQWGALGAKGVWEDKTVTLCTVESPDSLALDLFRFTVLRVPQLKTTMSIHPNLEELQRRERVDDTSIALFPRFPTDTIGLHVLLVSRDDKDVAFGPTPENIHTGDYPIRLPFYIVFKPERATELAGVVSTLLGEPVAAELTKLGYVPVPANARREAQRTLGAK
jgi:phosphate transport system substrate-binding protein